MDPTLEVDSPGAGTNPAAPGKEVLRVVTVVVGAIVPQPDVRSAIWLHERPVAIEGVDAIEVTPKHLQADPSRLQ